MMSTRRSFFTFGALVAAVAMIAPATALAQQITAESVAIQSTATPSFDKLEVTWEVTNATGSSGYRIFYDEIAADTDVSSAGTPALNPINAEYQDVSGGNTEKVTLTGLKHNTRYIAAVTYLDADDNDRAAGTPIQSTNNGTEAMRAATTEMANAPAIPRNVTAMGGDGTFTVMWEAPYAGETGLTIDHYRVQKREVAGNLFGDWVPDEGDDAGGKKVDGDMTMIVFDGLDNGVTYQARVRATNSADVPGNYSILDGDTNDPGDEAAMVGGDDMEDMEETPALPLVGLLALFAGLLGAARARLRR